MIDFAYYPDEVKAWKNKQKWRVHVWTEAEISKMMVDAGFSQESVSYDKTLKGGLFAKVVKQ